MSADTVIDRDEIKLQICLAAEQYLEARDELTAREDAREAVVDSYKVDANELATAENALVAAAEREVLALARLRAKVAA